MRTVLNTPQGPVIRDIAEPTPADNEALVAVRAFSVNRGELALLAARTGDWRPGQDVAGVVIEAAGDGSGPAPGTRVAGQAEQAGWAEVVPVPTNQLATLPDNVTIEQGAALPLAGLTAMRVLRLGGDLLGRRILITAANGGVGRFQTELASVAGARVTAVADPRHAKELLALGAATVVAATADADDGYHLVADSVGGDSLSAALAKVVPGGTIVVFGTSSGVKTPIDVYDFVGHEGARLVSYLSYAYPEPAGPDLRVLVELVATDRLHPTIGLVADWSELGVVLTALDQRRLSGKAVLTIG
jgi:NADPH:quinone reductase-like Zn-dependent oxidoreductase